MGTKHSSYGTLANIYDGVLTLTGFKRGIENFLDRIDFNLPKGAKILDAGTGTGLVALYLAKRFPDSEIIATDIDTRMLLELKRLLREERAKNVSFFQNDLNNPFEIRALCEVKTNILQENSFDAIFVSAALEHVDVPKTIPQIANLLKPGGTFLNLGMKKGAASAVFGMVYKFKEYSPDEIRRICGKSGLTDIQLKKLSTKDFPANLSRVAVIARKPA
uniref:Methyltransferase n=1 Tax=Candidatus Giovannonibacteria bacterium GW2011_GWF2_42_19 TaxID=1618659 RepID=A0A0G0ZBU6_9BACT|nr:MAG: Methyltransferase [Candidatus Giovannonibacteria bacterium GW2011_GWF2_42_19]